MRYFSEKNVRCDAIFDAMRLPSLLPANIEEMKQRITAALETVCEDMLQRVWHELEYRLNVSRVTGGAHIEHL